MNFDLNEDQKLLVESVRKFVKDSAPVDRVRKLRDSELGWDKEVWSQMAELGWLGVMFPEEVGGLGQSFTDLALVIEQLGTTLVSEPIIASVVLAGIPLAEAGSDEQKENVLGPMLAGETSLALAWAEAQGRHDPTDVQTRAEKSGDGWKLTGSKRWVLNGHAADKLLVSARTSGEDRDASGVSLFVVDPGAAGVKRTTVSSMDSHKAAMIDFEGVELSADALVGEAGAAGPLLEKALDYAAAAAVAEGSGIAQTALEMTRSYLVERKQFGVAIGTFQALQHRCVDMFTETQLIQSMAIQAMIKVADDNADERRKAVSAAKYQLSVGGGYVVRQATQLHGGIGVTDEHDIGLYFKRMQILNGLFGDEQFHVERFAGLPSFTAHVD